MTVKIKKAPSGKTYSKTDKPNIYQKFLVDTEATVSADTVTLAHKHALGKVHTTKKVSGQVVSEGTTQEPVLQAVASGPNYAKVGCSGGRTMQPAPFESVKIDVWLEIPCPNDPTAIADAYDFVSDWVSGKLQEAEAAFKGEPTKTVTVAAYPSDPTAGYVKIEAGGGGGAGGSSSAFKKAVLTSPDFVNTGNYTITKD